MNKCRLSEHSWTQSRGRNKRSSFISSQIIDHQQSLFQVLLSAVRNFGAKEWSRVSKQVPGRTQGQCRDRWINVLSRNIEKRFWTCCDDEILLFGVSVFGRGAWAKISTILEDKDARICRRRYQQLVGVKLKVLFPRT